MKKVLLSCMMLLGLGVSVFADEMKQYVPGESFTKVSDLKENVFAMVLGDKALYVKDAQNLGFDEFIKAFASTNAAVYFKLIAMPADAGDALKDYFLIRTYTFNGDEYHTWGDANNGFLNSQPATGWCSFVISAGANGHTYGQDIDNGAVWDVQYVEGEGFTLKNIGTGLYLNNAGTANNETPAYWNFCTLEEETVENPIPQPERTATDAKVISFDDFEAADWDSEAKTFTGSGKFNWGEDGLDLSQYQYLIATTAKNLCKGGYEVSIKDKNGKTVQGNQYGADFMNMWFGEWNNHNCMKIDLEKLRVEQQFDIYHITELTINGGDGFILGNVYATNQKPTNDKSWNGEDEGDFSVSGVEVDKFGTICLPFPAAVAGAYVYEIASANEYGVSLAQYDGLLEAGKAYIYKTNASNDGGKAPAAVRFYKATATTAESPVANNEVAVLPPAAYL